MKRVMMNLGTESKYDFFEARLKEKNYNVIRTSAYTPQEIIKAGHGCEIAVIGAEDQWTKETFAGLKDFLKLIVRFGVGLDNIDINSATENGVMVANSAGANKESVAELAVALMLSCTRRIAWLENKLRSGTWKGLPRSRQFTGKTVGLVGFGAIAKCVARMVKGFNCKILAYDIFQDTASAKELGVAFCTLDELLEKSDFVSLHIPFNPQTYRLAAADFFKKMKNTAILINTSRGGVVNEDDLYDALVSGEIKAAGLDVFDKEPPDLDNKLFMLENIIITPHVASATEEAAGNIADICLQNIESYIDTGIPKIYVNRK
ncbi:MAG TPA: phosphoglycerate dehydrogenase [Clostridiales bacterium]|nr:phosphoglycerate dehydrogenase [Clostridiales bacterium]